MLKVIKKAIKYRIKIADNFTLDDLKMEVKRGSKFIVFPYCISLVFAVTLRRFSPAIFIRKGDLTSTYKIKYNLISYIFGWWCIPWGPIRTLQSTKINNHGGIDVTEDILLNITEESLINKEVELKSINTLFEKPDKSDSKAFNKAIFHILDGNLKISKLVVGLYLNAEDGIKPHYVIGLKTKGNFDTYTVSIEKALYTQFYKHVRFEFIDLAKENEIYRLLEAQGEFMINSPVQQ